MAQITFTGFVQEWNKNTPEHPGWGMKVVENHRKQDGDSYVTSSRTYRTIKANFGVDIDFTKFKKDDYVEIVGKELTESTEKDGKRYDNLTVKADSVTLAPKRETTPVIDDSPF